MLHSDAGRRVLATLHCAPWHRNVEVVVATSGRTETFLKEREIQLLTWPSVLARPEPTRFSPLGERQFQSQLEQRATIVRTLSDLDPTAAEQASTTGFVHRCLAWVRARGGHVEHHL